MTQAVHNKLISFIWSIADDCLRDVYVRGKYRDVILPMVVLRRLDALLEPTKDAVMEELAFQRDEAEFTEWDDGGLQDASGYVFYNTSQWTLKRLYDTATNSQQILQANFDDYLNGFSPNVKEIVDKFKLKSQVRHMASKDVLLNVLEKFTSPHINLTPFVKEDPDGRKLPPLSNLGMGYVFEELIRKFNEENNEEAGEHFTPREVIELMTNIVFGPIKDQLPQVITIYDPACGSGGMLTESQNFIKDEEGTIRAMGDVYLYGKEINDETYAICKSDMMIKGNNPENIRVGSTLSTDEFSDMNFDFMLSNPPYGKSWSSEMKYIKDGKDIIDPRFQVQLTDLWGTLETVDATPRSSDGQLLFLMEMVDKMKPLDKNPLGARIASVHNGSSLFTGDAGGGESNIRRHIIENDLLECIIQLPNNLFYNTGITTYIWLLSNNKSAMRKGKVLLIDASGRFAKLRKNLGEKNCELRPSHIREIKNAYLNFNDIEREGEDGLAAKVFNNTDFGYYKVTIERPARWKAQFTAERIAELRYDKAIKEPMEWAYTTFGDKVYTDMKQIEKELLNWLGEIPESWELARLGTYFNERRTKVSDKDYAPLSVTKNGIVPQLDSAAKSNDGDNRKLVKKGDFVINSRSDRKGSSGIAFEDGSVSLINIVMKPEGIYPEYSNYLLKSTAFVEENYRIGHGIVADLWTTRYDEMKNIKVAIPSPQEQTTIATFLDDKTSKIDTAIAQKEQMIALLKERKQIVIQNAVTGKWSMVDGKWAETPKEKMKDSGVEWLREIPEGWEVKRIKHLYKIGRGRVIAQTELIDGAPFPVYSSQTKDDGILGYINAYDFDCEQITWTTDGANAGTIFIRKGKHNCTNVCGTLQANSKSIINKFNKYALEVSSPHYKRPDTNGAKIMNNEMAEIFIVQPTLEEQTAIATFLDDKTSKIDTAITLQQTQIEKLKEYKATLIDSAVTGKIRVSD